MVRAAGIEPARGYPQRIFLPASAFAASPLHVCAEASSWSGLSLHRGVRRKAIALGAARLVSTPSRLPFDKRAWLGIAI